MRTLWLTLLALAVFAGAVQAQIAAPRLNPLTPESTSPINPGILPWDGPSRIGGGLIDLEVTDTVGGVEQPSDTGDGQHLKANWVGETFALGLERVDIEIDEAGGGTTQDDFTWIAGAFQAQEVFSLGVGQQSEEVDDGTTVVEETLPLAGGTLRLGEVFYLGMAVGDETVEVSSGGTTAEADRGVNRYGVAYFMRDMADGLHVEFYRQDKDAINTAAITEDGQQSDGITLEVVFSNILLGYEKISTEFDTSVREIDEDILSVGWAPAEGLSVVVSASDEEDDSGGGNLTEIESTVVSVGWMF